jgi:RNA polymerase-binding transcription factor DksA
MGELNFDLASEIEDNQRAEAIEKARLASKPQLPPDWDGETCYQCGNEIGSDRLAAVHTCFCIHCQSQREKRLFK